MGVRPLPFIASDQFIWPDFVGSNPMNYWLPLGRYRWAEVKHHIKYYTKLTVPFVQHWNKTETKVTCSSRTKSTEGQLSGSQDSGYLCSNNVFLFISVRQEVNFRGVKVNLTALSADPTASTPWWPLEAAQLAILSPIHIPWNKSSPKSSCSHSLKRQFSKVYFTHTPWNDSSPKSTLLTLPETTVLQSLLYSHSLKRQFPKVYFTQLPEMTALQSLLYSHSLKRQFSKVYFTHTPWNNSSPKSTLLTLPETRVLQSRLYSHSLKQEFSKVYSIFTCVALYVTLRKVVTTL